MSTLPTNSNRKWINNERLGADDWTCPRCRKHNPIVATACALCSGPAVAPEVILAANGEKIVRRSAGHTSIKKALTANEIGVCVLNRTLRNMWFYTEMTAPIHWVHLRPGEGCVIPTEGTIAVTIGASFEEPNPAEVIGLQFAFAFGVLAFPVLALLPEPGTKAVAAYVISALAATGAFAGGAVIMGVANASNLKQVGVLSGYSVWELTEDLVQYIPLADGSTVRENSFHWTKVSDSMAEWPNRYHGFTPVTHGVDRGDLEDLPPLDSAVLDEIKHHSEIGTLYFDSVEYWKEEGTLDEHRYKFGGKGGSESSMVFGATVSENADGVATEIDYGLISEVRVSACKFIDAIQVKYNHRETWERATGAGHARTMGIFSDSNSKDHGGYGGYFKCDEGEYISRIRIKHDKYIFALQFMTNKGKQSPLYGARDKDGDHTTLIPTIDADTKETIIHDWGGGWIGYDCSYAKWMDSMTFLMAEKKKPAE